MTTDSGIVAVPDGVAHATAGAIVFWNLSGTTDAHLLTSTWAEHDLLPGWMLELPTPEVALRRAMSEQREKHRLVRGLKTGGWAIVREHQQEDDLDYDVTLKVHLSPTGRLVFSEPGGGLQPIPAVQKMCEEIQASFNKHLDILSREDIGGWLCDLVTKRLDGIALRGGGGIYFIRPEEMKTWGRVRAAVQEASSTRLYEIPAMNAATAVEAILDAVAAEAQAAADAVFGEVQEGELSARAIENRTPVIDRIRAKVERYEALVGKKLDQLHTRLDDLKASTAAAAMAAHAREMGIQAEAGAA